MGVGLGLYPKNVFVLDLQEKNKWLKRGTKNKMASKIVKKIFWTHMMEMIPFYVIFPNVVGFCVCVGGGGGRWGFAPQTPFSTYILSETRNYVYIIFCDTTIIFSAIRHHSNISLVSTNNI